jgi:hypothetical protein
MLDTRIYTLSPMNIKNSKEFRRWEKIDISNTPSVYWLNLGNGTQYKIITFIIRDALFLGVERIGCFLFCKENEKFPAYVAEKLNLNPDCEARNMADWLNIQLGFKTQEFGFYYDNFCVKNNDEN